MMMRIPNVLILLLLTFILSCGNTAQHAHNGVGGTGNIASNGDDESGIGGTGKPIPNGVGGTGKQVASGGLGGTGKQVASGGLGGTGKSVANSGLGGTGKRNDGVGGTGHSSGLGGTGQIAASSGGLGGTGIIGEITGFGSIFVNGIEVEVLDESEIRSDSKAASSLKTEIGDIVEILAHRVGDETHAQKINIRHEVVGPVASVNINQGWFTIVGQIIRLNNSTLRLPKVGQMIAVSGLRDRRGVIHATRLTESNSKSIWLIDRLANNKSNALKLGRTTINTEHASYYRIGDILRVRASYKNGQLFAEQIFSNKAFGKQVQHMVLQGFIRQGNRGNYQVGNIQFSTRSARVRQLLKQNQGRWTRVEVRRNRIGLWEVEQFIANSKITRGSLTPQDSRTRSRQLYQEPSTARKRYNTSIYDDSNGTTTTSPTSGGGIRPPGMPSPGNNASPIPAMPGPGGIIKPPISAPNTGDSGSGADSESTTRPRMPMGPFNR